MMVNQIDLSELKIRIEQCQRACAIAEDIVMLKDASARDYHELVRYAVSAASDEASTLRAMMQGLQS